MKHLKCTRIIILTLKAFIRKIALHKKLSVVFVLLFIIFYRSPPIAVWDSLAKFLIKDVNRRYPSPYTQPLINPWIEEQKRLNATYYRFPNNTDYHYEFRYEFNTRLVDGEYRLMIFIGGRGRTCIDYWRFPVGRRMVAPFREAGFSLLAICSAKRNYDVNDFVLSNQDVKWIYKSFQRWVNKVFFARFNRYPLIYLHGVSRGTVFAPMIARVLPVQGLLLTVNPGHRKALTTLSSFSAEMQKRISLDSTFANWFYFDYCYPSEPYVVKNRSMCPFQSKDAYFSPVPPVYFLALQDDPWMPLKRYRTVIAEMRNNSLAIGGKLLERKDSIVLDILPPNNVTEFYMQERFDLWRNKPYASRLFFQYYNNWTLPLLNTTENSTCRCIKADFVFLENFPDITATWSEQEQAEHIDYVLDIKEFQNMFCEDICGDLKAYHGMVSRNTEKLISWVRNIDAARKLLLIEEFVSRPLRVWMYDKATIVRGIPNYANYTIQWTTVGKQYRMYATEYLLQDYFNRSAYFTNMTHRPMVYTTDPLLADYFVVPHDLMFFYFDSKPETLNLSRFADVRKNLSEIYFEKLVNNIMIRFPYWSMTKKLDQRGANHIFAFPGGRAIGYLHEKNQKQLKNVVQLVYTGLRQDLLPPGSPILYGHYNTVLTYRHGYDIVMPQFTDIRANKSLTPLWNTSYHRKNQVFYFAGTLSHTISTVAARWRMRIMWQNMSDIQKYNMTIKINGKSYHPLLIVDGHVTPEQYVNSMLQSVFSLCPEGFLPWSPRLYEAIQLGAIPTILADNVVLPFERFIDWRTFSAKINVSNIPRMVDLVIQKIPNLKIYFKKKLQTAALHMDTFRWPYKTVEHGNFSRHEFIPEDDANGKVENVFHHLGLELRCRYLEQLYGFTSDVFSLNSIRAQNETCHKHEKICPCLDKRAPLAFHEYF